MLGRTWVEWRNVCWCVLFPGLDSAVVASIFGRASLQFQVKRSKLIQTDSSGRRSKYSKLTSALKWSALERLCMTRFDSIRLEPMTFVPCVPHPQRWGSETPAEHGDRETGRPSWGTPATETAKAGWGCGELGGARRHEATRCSLHRLASSFNVFQVLEKGLCLGMITLCVWHSEQRDATKTHQQIESNIFQHIPKSCNKM